MANDYLIKSYAGFCNAPSCFSLFFLEQDLIGYLAYGWLLCDVVGGHCTNGTKQTQTDELFRLIIVLDTLADFYFIKVLDWML